MAPADEIKYCSSLLAIKSRQRTRVMARQIAGFERLLDTLPSTTLEEDEAPFDETSVPDSEFQNDDETSVPDSESQSQNDDDQSVDASVTQTSQLDKPTLYSGERFGLATKTQLCDNRDFKETVADITYLRCPSDEAPSGETEAGTVLSHQSQSKFAIRRQIDVHFSKSRSAESSKRESAIPFDEPDPLHQQEVVSAASGVSAPFHMVSSVSTTTLKERYSHHKKIRDDRFHTDGSGSIGSSALLGLDRRWKRHQLSTNLLQRDTSLTRDADKSEVQKARKPIRGRQLFSQQERTSNVIETLERRRLLHLKEIRSKKKRQGALGSNKCSQSRHVRNNLGPDAIYFEESTRVLKTAHSHQNLDAEKKIRKRIEGAKTGKFVFHFPIAKSISSSKYAAPRNDEADATPSDEESSLLTGLIVPHFDEQTHPSLDDDMSSSSLDTYGKSMKCFGESSEGQTNVGPLYHQPLDTSESYASRETREVNGVAEELKRKYLLSANIAAAISRKDSLRRPAKSSKGQEKEIEGSSHGSSPQARSLSTSRQKRPKELKAGGERKASIGRDEENLDESMVRILFETAVSPSSTMSPSNHEDDGRPASLANGQIKPGVATPKLPTKFKAKKASGTFRGDTTHHPSPSEAEPWLSAEAGICSADVVVNSKEETQLLVDKAGKGGDDANKKSVIAVEAAETDHQSSVSRTESLTTFPSESVTEVEHTKKDLSEETMKMEQTSPRLTRVEIPTVGVTLLQIPDTCNANEDASLNETVSSLGDFSTIHETAAKRRTKSTKPTLQHNLECNEKFVGESISMTASSGSQTVWRFYEPEDTIIPAPPQVSEAETKQRQKRIEDEGKNIWRFYDPIERKNIWRFYDPIEIESLCLSAKEKQHTEQLANALLKLKEVSTTVDPNMHFSKCSSIQTSTHNGNERAPGFLEVHGQMEGRARDKDENSPPHSKDKTMADSSKSAVSDLSPHKKGCRESLIGYGPERIDNADDGDPQPYDVSTRAIKVGDISQFIDPNTVAATAFFRHMMPVVKPTVAKPSPEEANSLFNQLVDEYKYARGNIDLPTSKKVLDPKPRESLGHPRNSLASDSSPVTAVKAVGEALAAIDESSIKVTTVAIESLPVTQAHSLQAKYPALEEKGLRNEGREVDLLQDEMRPLYDLAIDSDFTFSHLRSASEDTDDQEDIHRCKETKLEDFEHVELSVYLLESKSRSEPYGDKRECSSIIPEDPYPDADDDSSHANGSEAPPSLPSDCSHGSNIDEDYLETPQGLAVFTGDEELEGQDYSHHNFVHRERSEFSSFARDQTQNFSRDHPETNAFEGTEKDLDLSNLSFNSNYSREKDEAETPRHANVSSFVLSGETREKRRSTFESYKPGQNVESKPFVDSRVSTSHSVVLDDHMFDPEARINEEDVQNGTVPDYAIAAVVQLIDKFKAEHERNKMICSTRRPIEEGLMARVSSLRSPALHRAEISNDISGQHCYSSCPVYGETPSQRINTLASSFSVHRDDILRQYSQRRLETNDLDEDVDRYSTFDDLDKYSASVEDVELDKYSSACEHFLEEKRDQGNSSRAQIIAGRGRYHPLLGALLLGGPDSGGQHNLDGSYLLHIKNDKVPAPSTLNTALTSIGPSDSGSAISNLLSNVNSASSERMSAIRSVARSVATDVFSKDFTATSSLGESKFTDQTSAASTAPSSGSSSGFSGETKDGSSLGTNSIVATPSGSAASTSVGLNLSSIQSAEERSREFNTRATPPAESRVRVLDPYALDFPSNPWPNQGIVGTKPCAESMSEFLWNPIFSCKCGVRSSFEE